MERIKEGEEILHKALPETAPPVTAPADKPAAPDTPTSPVTMNARRIAEDIAALDLNRITPLEALNRIHAWKALFDGKDPPKSPGKPLQHPARGTSLQVPPNSGPTLFDDE
jgi:DNA mismatch repair protein MutS